MKKTLAILVLAIAASAALFAGCGGGGDETTAAGSTGGGGERVEIVEYKYGPADLTVPAGTTVAFTNEDAAAHTATSKESGAFDTGTIKDGETGEITLEDPGTFAYFCAFHPFMKGSITVE